MPSQPETKRALIVVRTYPTPAKTGVEVSCTAAITDKGEWLRLFPIPWRFFDEDKRFRKYQWVDVEVTRPSSDTRPESHKLRLDGSGINILTDPLPTNKGWRARRDVVSPLIAPSLCHLQKQRDAQGFPTLGVFRPKQIERLVITPEDAEWSPAQMAILSQKNLFIQPPKNQLEKIPFTFRYRFTCDESGCGGHNLSCTDWEMGQSYRKWKKEYKEDWERAFRLRYEMDMIEKLDTHFFVGTVHQHPGSWIIVGLFYPPRVPEPEPTLFS